LIKKSSPLLARSGVVADDGGDDVSDIRTSDGTFLEREQDPTIAALERKLSEWTMIPVGNGEGLQVLRYRKGQEYQVSKEQHVTLRISS
jgi:prolyl 4-hydroxylase